MKFTRAMLTIALAASTSSALPMCKADSEGCASPQDLNLDNIEAATGANNEQSTHGSTQAHMESGFHSNGMEENLTTNQHAQRNIMKNSGTQGVLNMNTSSNKTDSDSALNGSGQQSEGLIQVSKTPESEFTGKGSSRSSGYNKLSPIQQNTSKYQQNSGANSQANADRMDHSQNQMHPNHDTTSNNIGFTFKVRELFGLFRQGQNQGQASREQQSHEEQNQQQQGLEPAAGIRQDKSQGQTSSNKNNMNGMENNSGMQQNQGMHKASAMPNHQGQHSMMQGQDVQEQMTVSQNQEPAHPDAQHHSAGYEAISQVLAPLYTSPNRKTSRSHTVQNAEVQEYDQESQQHVDAGDHTGQRGQYMVPKIQGQQQQQQQYQGQQQGQEQEAQGMMQMEKRHHEENQYQQGPLEQMNNQQQVNNRQQGMVQNNNNDNREQLSQQQGME